MKKHLTEDEFHKIDNHTNEERKPYLWLACKGHACNPKRLICPSCPLGLQRLAWINKMLDGKGNLDDFGDTPERRRLFKSTRIDGDIVRIINVPLIDMKKKYKRSVFRLYNKKGLKIGSLEESDDDLIQVIVDGKHGHYKLTFHPKHGEGSDDWLELIRWLKKDTRYGYDPHIFRGAAKEISRDDEKEGGAKK